MADLQASDEHQEGEQPQDCPYTEAELAEFIRAEEENRRRRKEEAEALDRKIAGWIAWAVTHPFSGLEGSKQEVFIALCNLALARHKVEIYDSVRTLAVRTNLRKETVSRALKALEHDGLIRVTVRHRPDPTDPRSYYHASVYEITAQEVEFHGDLDRFVSVSLMQQHEVFRRKGLGKSSLVIYRRLMLFDGATATELAQATGRHKSTVSRCLKEMAAFGLVRQENRRFVACVVDLNQVAQRLGVAGDLERQRTMYRLQRQRHRERIWSIFPELYPEGYVRPRRMRRIILQDLDEDMTDNSGPLDSENEDFV